MARRVLQDKYFRQAKREGYLARSAYKLLELQRRARLMRKGDLVLDMGCSPGSWLQVAAQSVGPKGFVVGIDLKPAEPLVRHQHPHTVRTVVGDATKFTPTDLAELLGPHAPKDPETARVDALISDMAPNTSGHGDHFRSVRLCEDVLKCAANLLRPQGNLVMKVFDGEDLPVLLKASRKRFAKVRVIVPQASRDVSKEVFVIGLNYRPPRPHRQGEDNGEPDPLARPVPPHLRNMTEDEA